MDEALFDENPQLSLAFRFITETGTSLFLSGKAGTGKTTFLRYIREHSPKRSVVLAPTGVSAINAGGMTLHSFFQLAFAPYLPSQLQGAADRKPSALRMTKEKIKIIRSLELLIIDEISMVRADVLDAASDMLIRYRRNSKPFGGVQVLFIGDVHQLAPVAKPDEWDLLSREYASPYFFSSKAFCRLECRHIALSRIYRQKDAVFIDLLERIRSHSTTKQDLKLLNSRYREGSAENPPEGVIVLTTHRHQASSINLGKLAALDEKSYIYHASIEGHFPEYSFPTDRDLELKKGAQVMFVKNDTSQNKAFFNGKIGKVVDLDEEEIWVQCPGDDAISVGPEIWSNVHYTLDADSREITEIEDGRFIQYPLKTAWAITIHKSQGLTFEHLVINASEAFAHGQVYVALSRCTSLDGLLLASPINERVFFDNADVERFSRQMEACIADDVVLQKGKKEFFISLLLELFDYTELDNQTKHLVRFLQENIAQLYPKLYEAWEDFALGLRKDIVPVSIQFRKQLIGILSQEGDYTHNTFLSERISKALEYFLPRLASKALPLAESSSISLDNKEHRKVLKQMLQSWTESLMMILRCQRTALEGFSVEAHLKARAGVITDEPSMKNDNRTIVSKTPSSKTPSKEKTSIGDDITNLELFESLCLWRLDKAKERNVPAYVILSQKGLLGILHALPRTEKELLAVKGVGKVFLKLYGSEILERISEYRIN